MSIERCLRALAFFSISAIASVAARGDVPAHRAKAAEIEATLAAKRDVYLVLSVEPGALAVRVRGVTLESVSVESVTAGEQRRLAGGGSASRLEVPCVFVTAATISLVDRKVVAPKALEPWTEDAQTGRPVAGPEAQPVTPSSYDVPLEGGWVLEVRQTPVDFSFRGRFLAALRDGWNGTFEKRERDRRPTVRLVMDETSAVRIHHLFKKGTAVLMVPDMSYRPRY